MTDTLLDHLASAIDAAQKFNQNAEVEPVAIFWPDKQRQWESVIERLQSRRRVVRFGPHDPALGQGEAYWLRCVIADAVELDGRPGGIPVVYLPGYGKEDLRTLEAVASEIAPLAALQHRAQWFSHVNGSDWTVRAFLTNSDRGLGLNVASDDTTATALLAALPALLDRPVERLRAKHIDADYLNDLLNPDVERTLLAWLDEPSGLRAELDGHRWGAFVHQCKVDFGFDPEAKGPIEGARLLGEGTGPWADVWQRFRLSPQEFPGIPDRLRQADPNELFVPDIAPWPARSADAEDRLRAALLALANAGAGEARAQIAELEAEHHIRRGHVWADLGWTPLVLALEHLAATATVTATGPIGTTVDEIADWYATTGWRADKAVLAALAEVDGKNDLAAIEAALDAIYRPWLDSAAKALQSAVGPAANAGTYTATPAPTPAPGTVVVFVDGLRLDVAHLLADRLAGTGVGTDLTHGLAALPTITQTSKPALVPIDQALLGPGDNLDARRAPDGPTAGNQVLKPLAKEAGLQWLAADETGDPTGRAWTEAGELDHKGHDLGLRLAHEIQDQVDRIARRIRELLDAGWLAVSLVTDHGWLLLPGGLPKNEDLPVAQTVTKKGRCARIKDGADVVLPTVPWHWDSHVRIAVAPGISCFEINKVYEHGGVSPQECVVPRLTVTAGKTQPTVRVEITEMKWRGLTLSVEVSDLPDGAIVDLRTNAGASSTSIATLARISGGAGKMVLLVEDDDREGDVAQLVVVGAGGTLLVQRQTTVGQNR